MTLSMHGIYKVCMDAVRAPFEIDLLRRAMIRTVENGHGLLRATLLTAVVRNHSPLPLESIQSKPTHTIHLVIHTSKLNI